MKRILIIFTILLLTACTLKNPQNGEYKVMLTTASVDEYEFSYGGPVMRPSSPKYPYYEPIKKYPENYKKKNDYHLTIQGLQSYYKTMCEDTAARKRFFDRYGEEKFEDWQKKYTTEELDCIVSISIMEDENGEEYVVMDENNDEDLSNDRIQQFQLREVPVPERDTTYSVYIADADVEFEYFDGNEIKTDIYGLRLQNIEKRRGLLVRGSQYGKFGEAVLGGEKYLFGITRSPYVEFSEYDNLWIDLNHNNKFDSMEDYKEQMRQTFTVGKTSYRVSDIDRFGESITIKVCNQDSVPPIGEGLPAPDFCETTMDSAEFRLGDYKGKYVILDFWICNANYNLPIINKVYNEFKNTDKIEILTFGTYDEKYLRPKVKEIKINWAHVNKFVDVETRDLYQASAKHELFLISPEGIILDRKVFAKEDDIIEMIKEHVN